MKPFPEINEFRPTIENQILLNAMNIKPKEDFGILTNCKTTEELIDRIEQINLARECEGNLLLFLMFNDKKLPPELEDI